MIAQISTLEGKLVATEEGKRQKDLLDLSHDDLHLITMQTLIGFNIKKTQMDKFGLPMFSFTRYEQFSHLGMLFRNEDSDEDLVLHLTMERNVNAHELELQLNQILQQGKSFPPGRSTR